MTYFTFTIKEKITNNLTEVFLNLKDLSYLTLERNNKNELKILSVAFKDGAVVDYENFVEFDHTELLTQLKII